MISVCVCVCVQCCACVHFAGHQFVIDFKAYKERLLEEMFEVYSAKDKRKTISFVFHARVLGLPVSAY